jgi:PleD family two-component response regulator
MAEQPDRSYEVYVDLATGLYDRRTMWSRLAEEVARAQRYHYPFSLMLITLRTPASRPAVEELPELARLLKRHTRAADILARYSEDTLAVLLPCTDERGAVRLAERIRQIVVENMLPQHHAMHTVHIGLTTTSGDYVGDKVALVEQVEWALRKAQTPGGEHRTVVVPAPTHAS